MVWFLLACKPSVTPMPTPTVPVTPTAASCVTLPAELGVPLDPGPVDEAGYGVLLSRTGTASVTEGFALNGAGDTEVQLPATLWLRGSAPTMGTLTVEQTDCPPVTSTLTARIDPGLSASLLPAAPGHTWSNAFSTGAVLRAAIDGNRFPQLEGTVDVYRVESGSWQQGDLVDVRGAPDTVEVSGLTVVELGTLDTPPSTISHQDLVLDLDQNGRFDPGDWLDGAEHPGLSIYPDLAELGPHTTESAEINAGFFRTQRVFWPTGLDVFDGPRPVVIISHGNGHEYHWYDYLQNHLASWGYIVMSHRSDTEPGIEAATDTLIDNADLFLTFPEEVHADLAGHLDLERVALIGHSRGGEAVLLAAQRLRNGVPTQTLGLSSIRFISSIAPTVFLGPATADAGDRAYHQLIGGADGDVTQGPVTPGLPFRCDVCKSARLLQGNTGFLGTTYLQGAIHNDFNCCGVNDGIVVNGQKTGRMPAQGYTRAMYHGLLGHHLMSDPHAMEFYSRMQGSLPLPNTGLPVSVFTLPDRSQATWLEDFQTETADDVASSGGTVVHDLPSYTEGVFRDANISYAHNENDVMNGMTESEGEPGIAARGAVFSFNADVSWELTMAEGIADHHRALSVRAAQGTRHPETVALNDSLHFSITLVGPTEVTIRTEAYGQIPAPYARSGAGSGSGWANEFNTVRIPLVDFESMGADLSAVTGVRLSFGPSHGSAQGRVAFDDLVLE